MEGNAMLIWSSDVRQYVRICMGVQNPILAEDKVWNDIYKKAMSEVTGYESYFYY